MRKITIAWSPNTQKDDLLLAISLLFKPWKWFGNKDVKKLEKEVGKYVGQEVVSFDSGRSSLYSLLRVLGIKKDDEILLQGFTCVALPNPILWVGAKPVYVDTSLKNFQIDIDDLEKKITKNSKAVIIQYTFGIAPDLSRIKALCEKHNLFLIEDCCHNLGQKISVNGEEKMAGTIGDCAIYSMGMEKVVSATRAGFATVSGKENLEKLKVLQGEATKPRVRDILRGIVNPIVWKVKEKNGKFGEAFYKIMIKIKLHELGLTNLELTGKKAPWLPYLLPNSNAVLGLNQIKKIDEFNGHRKIVANTYYEKIQEMKVTVKEGPEIPGEENLNKQIGLLNKEMITEHAVPLWLRFPLIIEEAEEVREAAKKQGIYLGNWYTEVIHCKGVDLCALGYKQGACPKSEWLVDRSINLPTHQGIGIQEIDRIIGFLEGCI